MDNSVPYEIIGAPFEMWTAPVGTPFPDVDETPAAPWALVGTSGNLNHSQDGIRVAHSQSVNRFRAAGDVGSRKAFRTEEDLAISLTLHDLTLDQYQHALNGNTVTAVPATVDAAGYQQIGLSRGSAIATYALLLRGPSPEMADGVMQYEVPVAMQTGSPDVQFQNGTPAGLALEWAALVDPSALTPAERFGRIKVQTTADVS
jgi:hypothetical protein